AEEFSSLMLQNATSKRGRGGRRKLPLAFTEHGAIMAATVLNSPRARRDEHLRGARLREAARAPCLEQGSRAQARGAGALPRGAGPQDPETVQGSVRSHPCPDEPAATQAPQHRLHRRSRREVAATGSAWTRLDGCAVEPVEHCRQGFGLTKSMSRVPKHLVSKRLAFRREGLAFSLTRKARRRAHDHPGRLRRTSLVIRVSSGAQGL